MVQFESKLCSECGHYIRDKVFLAPRHIMKPFLKANRIRKYVVSRRVYDYLCERYPRMRFASMYLEE